MLRRTAVASALFAASVVPSAGCWMDNPATPVIEAEDVSMDPPGSNGFRAAGERGEVYELALDVSSDVNRWVAETAVGMSRIIRELDKHPEDRNDGDWRVWGPHNDEDGADGSWMARIAGDSSSSSFEVYIGRRDASTRDMALLISGDVSVSDSQRDGSFTIDFDTIREYEDLVDGADPGARYGGQIVVNFERDTETQYKQVGLDFDGFFFDDGVDDLNFDGEHYTYQREADGAGQFHFATWSSFEDSEWSGPALERMVVDTRWDADSAGRARGQILEVDGEGDLRYGSLVVSECHGPDGSLSFRQLNEAYDALEPGYSFGEESTCVFGDAELEIAK